MKQQLYNTSYSAHTTLKVEHEPLDRLLELMARDIDLLSGSLNCHPPRLPIQGEAEARARTARRVARVLRGGV